MEKIICAAIKYHNAIFLGKRHSNCFAIASVNGKKWQYENEIQGFLTNNNRFVNRTEALKIAEKANQLEGRIKHNPKDELLSEDLY